MFKIKNYKAEKHTHSCVFSERHLLRLHVSASLMNKSPESEKTVVEHSSWH